MTKQADFNADEWAKVGEGRWLKGFVREVAQATARAHKEGGVLGI